MSSVKSGSDSVKNPPHYSWSASSRRNYDYGRKVGWKAFDGVDMRSLSSFMFLSGVRSGYSARKKYVRKGSLPSWVDKA